MGEVNFYYKPVVKVLIPTLNFLFSDISVVYLVDDVAAVDPDHLVGSSLRCEHGKDPRPAPNIKDQGVVELALVLQEGVPVRLCTDLDTIFFETVF